MIECCLIIEFIMPYDRSIEFYVHEIKLGDVVFQIACKGNVLSLKGRIKSKSRDEAYEIANEVANLFRLLMLYKSNIGLTINDIKIPPCIQIDEECRHIKLDVMDEIKLHDRVSSKLIFGENSVRELEKLFSISIGKYKSLNNEEKDKLNRIISWYIKGLLADDKVDKFIYYYIVLDAIAGIYYPKQRVTSRVKKILKTYNLKYEYDNKSITKIRGELFHNIDMEDTATRISIEFGSDMLKVLKEYINKTLFNL